MWEGEQTCDGRLEICTPSSWPEAEEQPLQAAWLGGHPVGTLECGGDEFFAQPPWEGTQGQPPTYFMPAHVWKAPGQTAPLGRIQIRTVGLTLPIPSGSDPDQASLCSLCIRKIFHQPTACRTLIEPLRCGFESQTLAVGCQLPPPISRPALKLTVTITLFCAVPVQAAQPALEPADLLVRGKWWAPEVEALWKTVLTALEPSGLRMCWCWFRLLLAGNPSCRWPVWRADGWPGGRIRLNGQL